MHIKRVKRTQYYEEIRIFGIYTKLIKMLTKKSLKEQIDKFPDQFSIEDLIEQLILIEKIETGNKQSENGEVISETELDNEIKKWFE